MKKTLAILLAFAMILGLAACGGTTTDTPATNEPTQTNTSTTTTTTTPTTTTPATTEPTAPVRENEERYGGDIMLAVSEVTSSMDPHFCGNTMVNYDWMRNVFEAPVVTGADGNVYPLICDYDLASDGLSLKLTMREYYFSNGDQVTIDDVVSSVNRGIHRPNFKTKFWDFVDHYDVEGDSVTYYFNGMSPTILQELGDINSGAWVMPAEICDQYAEEEIKDISLIIGTGPYCLEVWDPDRDTIVVRNENYSNVDPGGTGAAGRKYAYADRILYSTNTDAASRTAGMIAGDYNVASITSEMQPYATQIGLKQNLVDNMWTHYLVFNTNQKNPDSFIQNKDFRKAIRAALNCEDIMLAIVNGDAQRMVLDPCLVPESNTNYYNTIVKDSVYNTADMELARQYLEASGYAGQEITYLVPEGTAYYRAAMVIIPVLEELGINMNLWVCDMGSYNGYEAEKTGYDITFWETQRAPINPFTKTLVIQASETANWQNERKSELVNILGSTPTGSAESVKAFEEFNELIIEDCPYVCLGSALTKKFSSSDFVLNYDGITEYYWNSYFEK